ncbi:ribosome assembly protein METTL17, mitochondrial isoform X2 [Heterodontus francisci]|uniref:ribosome assembly protein METTL17, mitochondrial isoform X2 n=1 Tax=Heterodontus francisci TaxID=7792 RepID=UPI00355C6B68
MAAVKGRVRLCGLVRRLSTPAPHTGEAEGPGRLPEQVPHRRHPGISNLKTIRLPEPLSQAARLLLEQNPISRMEDCARELSNFLWSRKRAVEDRELQARAQRLWERFQGSAESSRTEPGSRTPADEPREEERLRNHVLAELRRTTYRWKPVSYDTQLSKVYVAARLDGGYAAVTRALHEIKKRVPDFQPRTLLDFGSGTGTVTWAGRKAWGATLREYLCVDSSAAMHRAAEFLMRGGTDVDTEQVSGVYFRHFLPVSPKVKFDLVVSAYSLSELPLLSERLRVVETLWRKTEGFLVLIENGTKDGHQILMEARDAVLKAGGGDSDGHVFAPNPNVKLEKFSYVILSRGSRQETQHWPRLIQPVLCKPRHVHAHLCCADGTMRHAVITPRKSGRDLYRWARNSTWGDRLPVPPDWSAARDGSGQDRDSATRARADSKEES